MVLLVLLVFLVSTPTPCFLASETSYEALGTPTARARYIAFFRVSKVYKEENRRVTLSWGPIAPAPVQELFRMHHIQVAYAPQHYFETAALRRTKEGALLPPRDPPSNRHHKND